MQDLLLALTLAFFLNQNRDTEQTALDLPPHPLSTLPQFYSHCQLYRRNDLTTHCRVLLEKLTVARLVRHFSAFYRNRMSITIFRTGVPPFPKLSQINPVSTPLTLAPNNAF